MKRNDKDLTAWLIERGADLEAVGFKWDPDGQTPLQLAQVEGRTEIAAMLKAAGARRAR